MPRILITGAGGYIGAAAAQAFAAAGWRVRGAGRDPDRIPACAEAVKITRLDRNTPWADALIGVDCVLHLAALTHKPFSETDYATVNVDGTEGLARAAVAAGTRHFLLLSSIGVNGSCSGACPLQASDPPRPENAYARSKLAAESRLREITADGNMTWTVFRPPLVYGPDAPGNFARLKRLVASGIPLPIGAAAAPRAYLGLGNLLSALVHCALHPATTGKVYLISDGEDISAADLARIMAACRDRRVCLPPVPMALIRSLAHLLGRKADVRRLFDPLQIDSQPLRNDTGWRPPIPLREGLCEAFRKPQSQIRK